MSDEFKIYKIKNNKTGQFSLGRNFGGFDNHGKYWKSEKDVMGHLAMVARYGNNNQYKDCSIVEFSVVPTAVLDLEERFNVSCISNKLYTDFNKDMSELFKKLWHNNELKVFRYGIVQYLTSEQKKEFKNILKSNNIKSNQYRTTGRAFAFSNKDHLLMFKMLSANETFHSKQVDLVDYMEQHKI